MDRQALAARIDHTVLKPDATLEEVRAAVLFARENRCASVCLNPAWVELAATLLRDSGVAVCTVCGFPLGATTTAAKAAEARAAWEDGAAELDMVLNIGALKSGMPDFVDKDIRAVVAAFPGAVKVILESGLLTEAEIVQACGLCADAGAAFVKTSTGFGPRGASTGDVRLMRRSVPAGMRVKAAGGVGTLADALAMLDAGADRIGASRTAAILDAL